MKGKYNNFIGYSVDRIERVIGNSEDAEYITGYLEKIGAIFCIEEKNYIDKRKTLMRRFPRFIWIIRDCINNKISNDQIYDATCNYQNEEPFGNIKFKIKP
jgi:hypothetical protein